MSPCRSVVPGVVLAIALAGCAQAPAARVHDRPGLLTVSGGRFEEATGFVVAPGRVVTVAHVIDDGRGRVAVRASGERHSAGRVLRIDRRADLALLVVPGIESGTRALVRSGTAGARVSLELRTGNRTAVVRRHVRALIRGADGRTAVRPALELAARVAPGDSGAPVLTRSGAVAGVVFARSETDPDRAYAVDVAALERLLSRTRRR